MAAPVLDALAEAARGSAGRPLVTWYDDATGERVELSVTTTSNWVTKLANLCSGEWGLEPGETLELDLPVHWLSWVTVLGAWTAGLAVRMFDPADQHQREPASAAVVGADGLRSTRVAPGAPILATALLPFGRAFPDGPPAGASDFALEVPPQPDVLLLPQRTDGSMRAWTDGEAMSTHDDIAGAAHAQVARISLDRGARIATSAARFDAVSMVVVPLVLDGSIVLVSGAGPTRLAALAATERATLLDSTACQR